MIRSTSAVLSMLLALLTGCAQNPARTVEPNTVVDTAIEHAVENQQELLQRDPNNIYGEFDNGVQYIVRHNEHPKDKAVIYMHIDAGALHETSAQNGVAHFLEHMAFNGSKRYAPGELIPFLSSLGMSFGADTNAHTNTTETVYKLTLPDAKPETLEIGLDIMADYAYGLLLLEEQINSERDIILNEKMSHKGAGERLGRLYRDSVFGGTRIAEHDVIGTDEIIKTAPRSEFVDFYDAWYRPDATTIIGVGDFDSQSFIAATKKRFDSRSFKPRAAKREFAGSGVQPITKNRAFVFSDPELPICQIQITSLQPGRPAMRTYEEYAFNEIENLAPLMLNRRLQDLVQSGDAKFLGAQVSVGAMGQDLVTPGAFAAGTPEQWQAMLHQLIGEVRRAIDHGFTQEELDLAKKAILSAAERAVQMEGSRDSTSITSMLAGLVGAKAPIQSAQQRLDLLKRILSAASLEETNKIFVQNFSAQAYTYVGMFPQSEHLPTPDNLLETAKLAWTQNTEAFTKERSDLTLLEGLPQPGAVVSKEHDADLNITTLTLSNGTIVHHRFMDYEKDKVSVNILIPGGSLEEDSTTRGFSTIASLAGATSRLSSTAIRDLFTGKKIGAGGGFGQDSYTMRVSGNPAELEDGLQLAYAYMTDSVVEPSSFDRWKQSSLESLKTADQQPGTHISKAMANTIFGGDPRFMPLDAERIQQLNLADAQTWAKRILGRAPLEVTIVGDAKLDAVLPLILRYIGSLPKATVGFAEMDQYRKVNKPTGPYTQRIDFETETDKAMVLAGFIGTDSTIMPDRRLLVMASIILQERMTKVLREERGLVYSISCSSQAATAVPGTGMFMAQAPCEPKNAEALADGILEMMREIAKTGPTAEEVEVCKVQLANILKTAIEKPSFWLRTLGDLAYRDKDLAPLKTIEADYQSYDRDMIHECLKKYIIDENVIRFIAMPKPKAEVGS